MEIFDDKEIAVSLASTEITVSQIVRQTILECSPNTPVHEAAQRMGEAGCSSIVVTDNGVPVGIWTERDAITLDFTSAESAAQPIQSVMSKPVRTVMDDSSLQDLASQFKHEAVRHFLVTDASGKSVGVVSQTDVVLHQGIEYFLRLRNIETVLKNNAVTVEAELELDGAVGLMRQKRVDALLIKYNDDEYGILTERDLVRAVARQQTSCSVGELASRPLLSVSPGCSLYRARSLLTQNGVRHIGVRSEETGEMLGVANFSDILYGMEHVYVDELRSALSERNAALNMSRRNLHLAEKVIDSSLEGIFITDANGVIESVNPAFCSLTGYSEEEVVGKNPSLLSSGRHDEAFYAEMWETLRDEGHWQGEVWNRRKSGEVFPELLTITAIYDEQGVLTNYAALFSDISRLKENEERIRNLAYYDPLTNLPNRRLLYDRLSMALAHAHRNQGRLAVVFFDLDRFKDINDSRGHAVGDSLLQEVARRLQLAVREDDTVARMGGDEFVAVLTEVTNKQYVMSVAERIIEGIKQPLQLGDEKIQVTCSLGVSIYPEDATEIEALLQNADAAMYRAKELGRDQAQLYSRSLELHTMAPPSLEAALHEALENKELSVQLQPLFLTDDEGVYGAEALLRWHHPEMGWIPPNDFLPLAEEYGLGLPITEFVLRRVCEQIAHWNREGREVTMVSINIPAGQFHSHDLLNVTRQVLEQHQIHPGQIYFELSERILAENMLEVIAIMHALREMGVGLMVDDFGTGHSSLTSLRDFPVEKLKIDRFFVQNIDSKPKDAALVSALIQLGHSMGMKVVAKGVERQEALDKLRQYNCDLVQGFYYSEAIDTDSFAERYLPLRDVASDG